MLSATDKKAIGNMKKAYILAALLLTACAHTDAPAETAPAQSMISSETTSAASEETTSEETSATTVTTTETTAETTTETTTETAVSEEETEAQTTVSPVPASEWLGAYRDKIAEITEEENEDYLGCDMFSLYDMTGDGIPELIVSTGGWHGGGAMIFSYRDGSVHQYSAPWDDGVSSDYPDQVMFGSFGTLAYTDEGGYIVSSYTGSGCTDASVYTIGDDDTLDKVFSSEYAANYPDVDVLSDLCTINGEECGREAFFDAIAPYNSCNYIELGRDYVLTQTILEGRFKDSSFKTFEDVAREIEEGTFRQMYDDLHFYPADAMPDYDLPEGCDVLKVFKVYDHDYAYAAKGGKAQLMDLTNGKSYDIPGIGNRYSNNYNAYIFTMDGKIFLKADEDSTEQFREFVFSLTDSSIVLDRSIPTDEHDWNDEYHQYYSESMIDLCPIYFCWDKR